MQPGFCIDICGQYYGVSVHNKSVGDNILLFGFQFVDKTDDKFLRLMNDNGEIREDLRCPDEELGKEIDAKIEAGESFLVSFLTLLQVLC